MSFRSSLIALAVASASLVAVPATVGAGVLDQDVIVTAAPTIEEGATLAVSAEYTDGGGGTPASMFFRIEAANTPTPVVDGGGGAWSAATDLVFQDGTGAPQSVVARFSVGSDIYRGTTQVTVTNATPVLSAFPDAPAPLDEPFSLEIAFTDGGAGDTHTADLDWGDGTVETVAVSQPSTVVTHTYSGTGVKTVTVQVADDEGALSAVESFDATVSVACLGLPVTIDMVALGVTSVVGTNGPDVILGTPAADDIDAGRGDDAICSGGGGDTIQAGPGRDAVDAGPGRDEVDGGRGSDEIDGGRGNDTLLGGRAGDVIEGGAGHDTIDGGPGGDFIDGGRGNDDLAGSGGGDTILGGIGRDTIHGGKGADALSGGKGADILEGSQQGDVLWGGPAADQLRGGPGGDLLFRSEWPSKDTMDGGPGEDAENVGKRGRDGATRKYLEEDEALAFKGSYKLSQFTTFHACCANRVVNIQTMANTVDGHVVMPGETWGVNYAVGRRTTAKGYKQAGAIISGWVQCCTHPANVGGGTSQFGTTIYNAVFFSGATDIEHKPHSLDFARYPDGREATMGYPHPDVVFRNDFAHPILITTHHSGINGTSIGVKFWGDNGGIVVTARDSGRRNIFFTDKIVYEANDSLDVDQEIVKTQRSFGYTIDVFRDIKFPDGSKTTQKWTWTYSAGPEVRGVHPCKVPPGMPTYTGESCPSSGGGGGGGGNFPD